MKPYLILVCIICSFASSAQKSDTTFFNKNWEKSTRDSASFFRLVKEEAHLFLVRDYFLSTHKLQMEGHFNNMEQGYKEGFFTYYDSTGRVDEEGSYVNDKKEGRWKSNYEYSDTLWSFTHFNNGASDGIDTFFFTNGSIKRLETYKNDELITGKCFDKNGKEIPYYPYQVMPDFPGGGNGVATFISKRIKYPKSAKKRNIEGRVIVRFLVNTDGSITEAQIVKGVTQDIDNEAIRVVKSMPKWTPGKIDNEPVRVWFTQPITFRLED